MKRNQPNLKRLFLTSWIGPIILLGALGDASGAYPAWNRSPNSLSATIPSTSDSAIKNGIDSEPEEQKYTRGQPQQDTLTLAATVSGTHERMLSYPFEQVWPTTIRYLRVNQHYELSDQDKRAGFILFRYPVENELEGEGSIEMIQVVDAASRPSVKLIVRMSQGPHHLAFSIAKGISDKIRKERGQPAPPPKKKPHPTPPPDASDQAPSELPSAPKEKGKSPK